MKTKILALMGAMTLTLSAVTTAAPPPARMDVILPQLEASITQAMRASGAPGMAIAVVQGNQIVYMKGFGLREAGKTAPVTTDTVFRVASVSKTFASTLAGILVDKQQLSWTDRLVDNVPNFALKSTANTQSLTLKNILSHTGGLPAHAYDNLIESNVPYETVLYRLREVNTSCPVGQCYGYQNVLYSAVSDVINTRTGKSFEEQLQDRLLTPLGMTNTSASLEGIMNNPNVAKPHVKHKNKWVSTAIKPAYYRVAPAGGINASIKDMANYLRAHMGHRPDVISPAVINAITTPVINTPTEIKKYHNVSWRRDRVTQAQYGLGWRIYTYAGREMLFHRGGLQGYRAEIAYLPDEQIGIVTLWNSGAQVSDTLVPTFFDLYLGLPKKNWVQAAGNK